LNCFLRNGRIILGEIMRYFIEIIYYKIIKLIIYIKYIEYIRYFSKKISPKNILSEKIIEEYLRNGKELPQVYKDVEKEYSKINISAVDSDTISMIYLDMSFLSDEFICYCLPVLIQKSIEYKDGSLLKQLKNITMCKLSENDVNKIIKLIKKMETENIFSDYKLANGI
jgi:hypothetical protein